MNPKHLSHIYSIDLIGTVLGRYIQAIIACYDVGLILEVTGVFTMCLPFTVMLCSQKLHSAAMPSRNMLSNISLLIMQEKSLLGI